MRKIKRSVIIGIAATVAVLSLARFSAANAVSTNQTFALLPTTTTGQVVKHDYYTLSYAERYEQAEWVAYWLKPSSGKTNFKRPYFTADPKVATHSADYRNYKNSGYDKGHLCAAADMKFSKEAFDDTFYTSNISPQKHDFNDGVWNRLEEKSRYWAGKYNALYVVTGGVLSGKLKTIGREKVAVPDYFYKILLQGKPGSYNVIAFLVPHHNSQEPLYKFVVSIDAIEKATGIDFFPQLDDATENALEKNTDYKAWAF